MIKSLVGHILCFRWLALVSLLCLPAGVAAVGNPLTDQDKAIAEMAKSLRAQSNDWGVPINEHQIEASRQASNLVKELRRPMAEQLGMPEKQKPGGRVVFFVSFTLGEEGLQDVLETAANTEDALVVFRGVKDPKNFAKSIMEIQRLAAKQSPMPNVIIDPTLFRDYAVTAVPTILMLDESRTKEIARVAGLSNPSWLTSKVKAGQAGDFGVMGDVLEIAEKDLIEVMKEKVASIDWEQKKEVALKRYWDKQQFIALPRASQPRIRMIDPSIYISDDIKDAEGKIIVKNGTIINPLELLPFTQALVVFDPLDEKQIRLVDSRLPALVKRYPRVTLIVSRFERSEGWKSYKSVTDHFDAPVFKLTSDVQSRFEIQYLPSIITADRLAFRVEELALTEESGK